MRTSRPPTSASKYLINIKQQAGCFDKTVDGFIYKFDTAEYDMSLLWIFLLSQHFLYKFSDIISQMITRRNINSK